MSRINRMLVSQLSKKAFTFKGMSYFSKSNQLALSQVKQQAQMALDVIRMIQNYKQPAKITNLKKYSHSSIQINNVSSSKMPLSQKIKDFVLNTQLYDQTVKAQLQKLFIQGTPIQTSVFSQRRMKDGKITHAQYYVYCPNSLITKQIFKAISGVMYDKASYILKGCKGVSKTWSTSLYWILVQFIDRYRFSKNLEASQIKKFRIPKIIYWTINQLDDFDSVRKKILIQCPELKGHQNYQDMLITGNYFHDFYHEKDIQIIFVADQIDLLVQLQRQKIALINEIQRKKNNQQDAIKSDKKRISDMQNIIRQLGKILQKIIIQFDRNIFLSSMSLQNYIQEKIRFQGNGIKDYVETYEINYSDIIYDKQSSLQISNFFVFEFQQRICKQFGINLKRQTVQQIQSQCVKYLEEKKYQFFITLLNIRQSIILQKNTNYNYYSQQLKDQIYMKTKVITLFKQIINYSTQLTKQQFLQSFEKKDSLGPQRYLLALAIYTKAKILTEKRQSDIQQGIQHNFSRQSHLIQKRISLKDFSLQIDLVKQILDLKFFSIDNKQSKLAFRLPAQFIVNILQPLIYKSLGYYIKNENNFMEVINNPVPLGCMIQQLFILALRNGGVSFSFNIYNPNQISKARIIQFNSIKKGAYRFRSLLSKKPQNNNLVKNLIPCFTHMVVNQYENAVFLPVKAQYFKSQLMQNPVQHVQTIYNNSAIDLFLVKNQYKSTYNKKIIIYAIDVTISDEKKSIPDKIYEFLKIYLNLLDSQLKKFTLSQDQNGSRLRQTQFQIQLRYFVFGQQCKQNEWKKDLIKDFQHKIQFSYQKDSNVLDVVKIGTNENALLKQIGYINLAKDGNFKNIYNSPNTDVANFEQLFKILNKKRKQSKKLKIDNNKTQ